jgi:uncharacterized hydrophobic protein (TIGR00271 family)
MLVDRQWVTNVTVQADASIKPPGDLVECDVAREKAEELLQQLTALGLDQCGGIVLTAPTGTPFAAAGEIESAAPGHPDDAVIWESVTAKAEAGAVPTVSYHVFLLIAVALAGVAVITDSAILVVGAMVVGPEFSAIASACAGLVLGRWLLLLRSIRLLLMGFAFAILSVTVLALIGRAVGVIEASDVTRPRPNTGFIWHPDLWSITVALLAGAAGALALAVERSAIMVGVFISVTTVPAAGNLALGLALWETGEIFGSLAQLGVNIGSMLVAGTLVLAAVRGWWPWLTARSERMFGVQSAKAGAAK